MIDYIPSCSDCHKTFKSDEFLAGPDYNKNKTFRFVLVGLTDELYIKNMKDWEKEKMDNKEFNKLEKQKSMLVCPECSEKHQENSERIFRENINK